MASPLRLACNPLRREYLERSPKSPVSNSSKYIFPIRAMIAERRSCKYCATGNLAFFSLLVCTQVFIEKQVLPQAFPLKAKRETLELV